MSRDARVRSSRETWRTAVRCIVGKARHIVNAMIVLTQLIDQNSVIDLSEKGFFSPFAIFFSALCHIEMFSVIVRVISCGLLM